MTDLEVFVVRIEAYDAGHFTHRLDADDSFQGQIRLEGQPSSEVVR